MSNGRFQFSLRGILFLITWLGIGLGMLPLLKTGSDVFAVALGGIAAGMMLSGFVFLYFSGGIKKP